LEVAIALGVVVGLLIFALKAGMGCGLAHLSWRGIMLFASGYLLVATGMGLLIDHLSIDMMAGVIRAGVTMHAILALCLIALGMLTVREWRCSGRDMSRKTFWALSIPCPACMAATFLSCSVLADLLSISPARIGAAVGIILFVTISSVSLLLRRLQGGPGIMGNVMMLLGGFYIISIMLLPSYIQMHEVTVRFAAPEMHSELVPAYLILIMLISLGYVIRKKGVTV
jgi:predicted transporter